MRTAAALCSTLCFAAALFLGCAVRATGEEEAKKEPKKEIPKVPAAPAQPKIDGALDDACWQQALKVTKFKAAEGADVEVSPTVYVLADAKNLYIGIELPCDKPKDLRQNATGHDGEGIWEDDSVELFLDTDFDRQSYYQIIVNSGGATWDAHRTDPAGQSDTEWQSKCEAKVVKKDKSWVVEMALPLAAMNREKQGKKWGVNLVWNNRVKGAESYWFPIMGTSNHSPDRFGEVEVPFTAPAPEGEKKN